MRTSWIGLFIGLLALSGASEAQLVRYDRFDRPFIDPRKWHGVEDQVEPIARHTETMRQISFGRLLLNLTSYGSTDSNSGGTGFGSQRLEVNDPALVKTMQADVIVGSAVAEGCAANSTFTRGRAMISGTFFNDGSSSGPGDPTGDVFAQIRKIRDSASGDFIDAIVLRCANSTCSAPSTTLGTYVFRTRWTRYRPDTLRLQWDPDNDQFLFAVNPGTAREEMLALPYNVSDSDPPSDARRELQVQISAANCTGHAKKVSMLALFDNVMVNPEASP